MSGHHDVKVAKLECGCLTSGNKNEVYQCSLHAAAPELLEACKLFESADCAPTAEERDWIMQDVRHYIRRAIAKAEGR